MSEERKATLNIVIAMAVWGTVGLFVKYIGLNSTFVSLARGVIGLVFLAVYLYAAKKPVDFEGIRENLGLLIASGTLIGFNWVFLFESYNYTTVAVSTLCYYMAPVIIIAASPVILREKLTLFDFLCVAAACVGMVLITGADFGREDASPLGVVYGLLAAVGYASGILLNKKMKNISNISRTIAQLAAASAVMFFYALATGSLEGLSFTPLGTVMLLIVGVVHTGLLYYMYFGALGSVSASKAALTSYIDPVVATLCSALILREEMTVLTVIGALLIMGGSLVHTFRPDKSSGEGAE